MEYLLVILSVSSALCESLTKAQVPLLNNVKAPLVAELDITGVKNELKEYIDVQVEKQFNQTSDAKIKTVVNDKVLELKYEMMDNFSTYLHEIKESCDSLLHRFTKQFELIENILKNENKELRKSELKSYFEGFKNNLTMSQENDLGKENQRCFNGGTFQTNSSTFYCICAKGYIGDNCQYTDGKDTSFLVIFHHIYVTAPRQQTQPQLLVASDRPAHLSINYFQDNRNQTVISDKSHPEYNLERSVLMQDGVHDAGMTVHSNVSVTMYGVLIHKVGSTSEGFLVIPERFASREFFIPSYTTLYYSVFVISPLFDSTILEIMVKLQSGSVSYNGTNYWSGDTIQLKLNKKKTFQLSSYSDLSGTFVKASMPVVVVSGNTLARVSKDGDAKALMEMVLPTNQLDHLYVIPYLSTRPNSVVRVLTVNATTLLIRNNTNTISKISNSREYIDFIHKTISYVQSSNDVLVMMYPEELPEEKGSTFMMTIHGVNQYLQSYDFVVPTDFHSFISITVNSEGIDSLILDGQPMVFTSVFSISEASDHFSTFSIPITSGFHHIEHRNMRFGLWVYGNNYPRDSYGYPAGIAFKSFN